MTLSSSESLLIFTTANSQLLRTDLNLDRRCDDSKYDFLLFPFHTSSINSLDICLKKPLVATCGHDNTLRIWNYSTRTLDICESFMDEPLTAAFHPSGLQIVVGFVDKIRMMNVNCRNLKVYHEIHIKACREIKFSQGGHLFACADNHNVKVYRFYKGDCPEGYIFKEHVNKVRSITWFEDDSGFVSAGLDGSCVAWKLHSESLEDRKEQEKLNVLSKISYHGTTFLDVALKTDSKSVYYALTEQKHIK